MFNAKWVSTDYSESTADSAEDNAGATVPNNRRSAYKKRKKTELWTSHPPNFRSQKVRTPALL
jgi:hypothetical protein